MRIKRIHISNYRAFLINDDQEINRYKIDLPAGENLLLYGENGSGKSSLFKAMKEFLASALDGSQPFHKNIFYDPAKNSEQPFIAITLDDDKEHFFSSDTARTDTNLHPDIKEANITKGFISYRDLLKLHFGHNNESPDLFSFFLNENGLLADSMVTSPLQAANRIPCHALWKKIQDHQDADAIIDYNINAATRFQELEAKANLLLDYFHKECSLKINYTDCAAGTNSPELPSVNFEIMLFGKSVSLNDDVLNEARLTSLAISVYLAHILSLPPTALKILFLDDIFTGLDMSNRLPLIKILTAEDLGDGSSFRDFQIFVTTYDRDWFNVAKNYLGTGWEKVEFYVDSQATDRPFIRRSGTYRERAEFHFFAGDYPACANYLRKEFERILRNILPENLLHPGFAGSSGENSIAIMPKTRLTISENEEAWFFKSRDTVAGTATPTFRFISLQEMINQFKSFIKKYAIPFPYVDDMTAIKNRLLNPLSHDDLKSAVFRNELKTGFEILTELEKITSRVIISLDNKLPVPLFCAKKDHKGDRYYFGIELKENLRYFQYETFRTFIDAKCSWVLKSDNEHFLDPETMEKDFPSFKKLCKAIFVNTEQRGVPRVFDEDFIFNEVYGINGKKLSELI